MFSISKSEEVKKLVSKNQLQQAISILKDHFLQNQDKQLNDVVELERQFNETNNSFIKGTISTETKNVQLVKISLSILILADRILSEQVQDFQKEIIKWQRGYKKIVQVLMLSIVLVFLSSVVSVPYYATGKIVFSSTDISTPVYHQNQSPIVELLVQNEDLVQEGDVLIKFVNDRVLEELDSLEHLIEYIRFEKNYSQNSTIKSLKTLFKTNLATELNSLVAKLSTYYLFTNDPNRNLIISSVQNRLRNLRELNRNVIDQIFLLDKEVSMSVKNVERLRQLYEHGAEDQTQFEKGLLESLNKKRALVEAKKEQVSTKIEIDKLKESQAKLNSDYATSNNRQILEINKSILELEKLILHWKDQHLLLAPISGKVYFSKILRNNHKVVGDDEVLRILPMTSYIKDLKGKVRIPFEEKAGHRIRIGQKVILEWEPPHFEIEKQNNVGTITNIILNSQSKDYIIEVILPLALQNMQEQSIDQFQMQGRAKIEIGKISVFDKLFRN